MTLDSFDLLRQAPADRDIPAPRGPIIRFSVVVTSPDGLNLLAARGFAAEAVRFASDVSIRRGSGRIDGKSILDLMSLAAEYGARLDLEVSGWDAEDAAGTLRSLEMLRPMGRASGPVPG